MGDNCAHSPSQGDGFGEMIGPVEVYAREELVAPRVGLLRKRIMRRVARPEPGEYAPKTVQPFQLVPDDDVLHNVVSIRTNYGEPAQP
jgi:hypothetical protein